MMLTTISQLTKIGKNGTAATYKAALASFMRFRDGSDIALDGLSSDMMIHYEAWLCQHHVGKNCSSSYLRSLRAVYNRAVESGITRQQHPFRHVYTGIDKTSKRAVTLEVIRKLKSLDLTDRPALSYARDLFLFSFYTRGMSFVDMAFLRRSDIRGGYLVYARRKTRQQLSIKWEGCMKTLVGRLTRTRPAQNDYLLPIIRDDKKDAWRQYKSCQRLVNHHLKTLSRMMGTEDCVLTMYVARHSWASIARSKNVPLAVISEAMGHDNEQTTLIYLSSIDTSRIDEANRQILADL